MKKTLLIALFVSLIGLSTAHAQVITTGPVTTANHLAWDSPDNIPDIATAQAQEYRFRDNGGAFFVVPAVTCTGTAIPIACTANLTAAIVASVNSVGSHSLTLSIYNGGVGLEGAQSLPFTLKSPAKNPLNLKVTP